MSDSAAPQPEVRSSLFRHVPPGQLLRYLMVGAWNTLFGYATYVVFTALLSRVHYGYVLASLIANLLNITVAFLGYKWFVFRTRGHYLREWVRCVMVYSTVILLGMVLLPPVVYLVSHVTGRPKAAPYIAGLLITGMTVILSFLGHKTISFRHAIQEPESSC